MPSDPIDALIEAIYAAAAADHPWSAVADDLRALVGAGTGALIRLDPATGAVDLLGSGGMPEEEMARYASDYGAYDPWAIAGQEVVAQSVRSGVMRGAVLGPEIVPEQAFRRSAFHADFARRVGIFHLLGAMQPLGEAMGEAMGEAGVMLVGLHRPERRAGFGESERRVLDRLLPHLRRAVQLRHRLVEAGPHPAALALDAMPTGAVLVDAMLRVLHANRAAEAMARGGGLRLQREGGGTILTAAHPGDAAVLVRRVRAVAMLGAAGGGVGLRRPGAPALVALVMPVPGGLAGAEQGRRHGQALVLLRDPAARPVPPPALLADLYGLTPAEAEVALAAAMGATAEAIAARRGTSVNTVRRQVRTALEKTDAASLRDLTRLVGSILP